MERPITNWPPPSRHSETPEGRRRDHTGAPLPHDATEPDGGFSLDHDVETVEDALRLAVERWNVGRYFEAHELLEHVWHHAPDGDRLFWQGVIQVAVAHVLLQRDRPAGVPRTVQKARAKFIGIPAVHHGIDVAALLGQLADAETVASVGGPCPATSFPSLTHEGPWFSQPRTTTALTREPPWLVASRERATRDESGARATGAKP